MIQPASLALKPPLTVPLARLLQTIPFFTTTPAFPLAQLAQSPNQVSAFPAILTALPAAVQAQPNVSHAQVLIYFLMVLVS